VPLITPAIPTRLQRTVAADLGSRAFVFTPGDFALASPLARRWRPSEMVLRLGSRTAAKSIGETHLAYSSENN
jgi:hypothetical protein